MYAYVLATSYEDPVSAKHHVSSKDQIIERYTQWIEERNWQPDPGEEFWICASEESFQALGLQKVTENPWIAFHTVEEPKEEAYDPVAYLRHLERLCKKRLDLDKNGTPW